MIQTAATMLAAYLPGNSTVSLRQLDVPTPGYGQVLLRMKASTICGSDIRAIYREHLGKGPEAYQNVVAGHEPCGQITSLGSGCMRFQTGDRVIVYHISGCGLCNDCRRGYAISCSNERFRRAYGWQRDGGMAEYLVADEKDLIHLPDPLSYADGAQVACGFGTAFEGLQKVGISGSDCVLVTGLGPVGLAVAALARKLGAQKIIGIDAVSERVQLALELGLCDEAMLSSNGSVSAVRAFTNGKGVERAIDCSGNSSARAIAIRATRKWGKIVFLGEGGTVEFNPSPDLIHEQKTIYGSWVTSLWLMEDLVEQLVRWNLHPSHLITNRFPLQAADEAYALMAAGRCGKVAVCFDEELSHE
jgi:threonine dehydrogenase-like Zn-dependent dehydrogenase